MNQQRFTYRDKILLRKNKRTVMSNVLKQERREQIKTERDVTEKIKERVEENGAEHRTTGTTDIRVVWGLSADRKLEIEDRRRAETKATWPEQRSV